MSKKRHETEAPAAGPARVRLTRPGVRRCGPYEHGQVYEVPAPEAERLVTVKGFEYAPHEQASGDTLSGEG